MRRGEPLSETVDFAPHIAVVNLLQMIPHYYSYLDPLQLFSIVQKYKLFAHSIQLSTLLFHQFLIR